MHIYEYYIKNTLKVVARQIRRKEKCGFHYEKIMTRAERTNNIPHKFSHPLLSRDFAFVNYFFLIFFQHRDRRILDEKNSFHVDFVEQDER